VSPPKLNLAFYRDSPRWGPAVGKCRYPPVPPIWRGAGWALEGLPRSIWLGGPDRGSVRSARLRASRPLPRPHAPNASLGRSKKLLQRCSPSSFLGDQRYEPFPLAGEIERTPKVDQTILTDQQVRVLTQQFVEQRIVPPLCPHCHINMRWYRSKQAKQNAKIIEHQFSCSSCNRTALVASWRRTA